MNFLKWFIDVIKFWITIQTFFPFLLTSLVLISKTLNPLTPEVINIKLIYIIPYIIQQTGNENIQTYRVEAAFLILHQVLITNLQGNM